MRVAVVGAGYVGLVSGACFAHFGHDVICVDKDASKTEWNEFRALDFKRVSDLLKSPVFVDLRNVYRPQYMAEHGFHYSSIGRG